MILLEGLGWRAEGFQLANLHLEVAEGEYAVIIGPTGSGKTTLLDLVAGHRTPAAGRVWLSGRDATGWPPERRGIGMVYQRYYLFPHRSVRENIAYGLCRVAGPERESRVRELARQLELEPLLGRGIRDLSGGEQQRVAVARALAPRPRILLLDEPLAAVDPATRRRLREWLRELHQREGLTTLHVTHDFEEALSLADRVAVLDGGTIAQEGPPEVVFQRPATPAVAEFVGAGTVLVGRIVAQEPAGAAPFAAWFESEGLRLEVIAERTGPGHAVIRPEDIALSRDQPSGSARNRLRATIRRLERVGPVTRVHLDAGRPLLALVTSAAADELALEPGAIVTATIKATAIHLL